MLSWIIQITFISILFIFLIDHLIKFFTNTLTVPKIKDLVNNPNKKYESIYEVISQSSSKFKNNSDINSTDIFNLPILNDSKEKEEIEKQMKNELKTFLKSQLNVSNDFANYNEDSKENSFYEFK